MTRILVTGGGGLIGGALRPYLPEACFALRADADLADPAAVERLFKETKPERVLHLAAEIGGVKKNAAQNADLFAANALINVNVLSAAQRHGVKRLVSALSACCYAFYPDRPSTEKDLHVGLPFAGNLGYGCSKRMLDIQTRLLWEQHGCKFSTITPLTTFGPGDDFDLENGHVVGSLIHKCFLAKREGKALEVWGGGNAVRQFVFAADVARVLVRSLDSFDGPDSVVVAPDDGMTIRDLARHIAEALEFSGPIVFDTAKPEGQLVRVLKSERFARAFPGFAFTPFKEALQATVRSFVEERAALA